MSTTDVTGSSASASEQAQQASLQEQVTELIQRYFAKLEGVEPRNLYELVLEEIEVPLLQAVMKYVRSNQSKAARILGLARGTLRKKLKRYGML